MAQRHYLTLAAGSTVEVTDRVTTEGWEATERAEEGAAGSAQLWLADPDMDLDVDGLRAYVIVEDDSEDTDNVLFGGIVTDPELSRGEQGGAYYDPLARMWQITIADRNERWTRRVLKGTDCKRPEETDIARANWVLGTSESDWIDDATSWVVASGGSDMDKVDYRGRYVHEVMVDCSQQSGRNWWVKVVETGTGREDWAWYGKDSRAVYSSDLYLSNDPDDWEDAALEDGTSLVWPISDDTKLKRDLSRLYTGVYLRYANGRRAIYRYNSTTGAVYGRRDHVADYPDVKTKAKAIARATRLLNDLGEPDERITTTVTLPKGKATMIRAGMRVKFKATHLEGYSDQFYWMRCLSCTVVPKAAGEKYELRLVLQASGSVAAGSGPYEGAAFGALLDFSGYGGTPPLEFIDTGDGPLAAGWYLQPTVGPITPDVATQSITIDATMSVRIHFHIDSNFAVSGPTTASVDIVSSVNGVIATASASWAGGLSAWGPDFEVDMPTYDAVSGEVLTYELHEPDTKIGGGFTGYGRNSHFFRVGRGTHVWNSGTVIWEGP